MSHLWQLWSGVSCRHSCAGGGDPERRLHTWGCGPCQASVSTLTWGQERQDEPVRHEDMSCSFLCFGGSDMSVSQEFRKKWCQMAQLSLGRWLKVELYVLLSAYHSTASLTGPLVAQRLGIAFYDFRGVAGCSADNAVRDVCHREDGSITA